MPEDFQFDGFLNHNAKDKPLRELAQCLRRDEEQIKSGDNIPAKIQAGLERSRMLMLCIPPNPCGIENDLSRSHDRLPVRVIICPRGQ